MVGPGPVHGLSGVVYHPVLAILLMIGLVREACDAAADFGFCAAELWRLHLGCLAHAAYGGLVGAFDWSDPGDVCRLWSLSRTFTELKGY